MRCSGAPDTLFVVFPFQCVFDSRLYKKEYHKLTDKLTLKGNNCNKNLLYIKEIALERMHLFSILPVRLKNLWAAIISVLFRTSCRTLHLLHALPHNTGRMTVSNPLHSEYEPSSCCGEPMQLLVQQSTPTTIPDSQSKLAADCQK